MTLVLQTFSFALFNNRDLGQTLYGTVPKL